MRKVLLLRSGGEALPGVDTLLTHAIEAVPAGIAEALSFSADGAWLIVTSRTTVNVLAGAMAVELFSRPFALAAAAGEETARAMRKAGAAEVLVPGLPGAAGLVDALAARAAGKRILWPRGGDADPASLAPLGEAGATVTAPIVYEKKPAVLDPARLAAFRRGEYDAVAVASLAALDVFLEALGADGPGSLPAAASVTWGVVGPETARILVARGFPSPVVPARARLADLVTALQHPTCSSSKES